MKSSLAYGQSRLRRSIGTFVLRFMATALLIAPAAAARAQGTGQSINLCPPSFRMTEHDGCQKSNDSKSGSFPAHVKDDAAVQWWKEIVPLINDTPSEIQACVLRGPLNMRSTQDEARAEISRCQHEEQRDEQLRKEADLAFSLINNAPPEIRSCVWRGSHDNWTQDKASAKISLCQREIREINVAIAQSILRGLVPWIVGILLLALAIGFRAKIAAGLYDLFVRCLALRLRFNRSRKRFLDNAIKEAENRLG